MSAIAGGRNPQVLKWVFFGAMALATLLVIHADETFLVSPADHEWRHIARFKWLLLPHGLAGAVALFAGPLQFSDRIRANRPRLHRWTGRIYIGAICLVAAPLGLYIGSHYEPRTIHVEQYFQAGLWWLTTAIAFVCILNRQIAMHKVWMMRSYGYGSHLRAFARSGRFSHPALRSGAGRYALVTRHRRADRARPGPDPARTRTPRFPPPRAQRGSGVCGVMGGWERWELQL